jgi:hypothetical protein
MEMEIDKKVETRGSTFVLEKEKELGELRLSPNPYAVFQPNGNQWEPESTVPRRESKGEKKERERLSALAPVLECCNGIDLKRTVIAHGHGFFDTIYTAFQHHYKLELRPDDFWQVILEGFSRHVHLNSEKLRSKFVSFSSGKKKLDVERDDFVLGAPDNNWPSFIEQIVELILENTSKELAQCVVGPKFSTSTDVHVTARQIALMTSTSDYFEYRCSTCCGIPQITLLGKREDWVNLQKRIEALKSFMLEELANFWLPSLDEIAAECVATFDGKVNVEFWQSICKFKSESGSGAKTLVSGWINNLFPFADEKGPELSPFVCLWKDRPDAIEKWESKKVFADDESCFYGRSDSDFYRNFSCVDVLWLYFTKEIPMDFKTGFGGPLLVGNDTLSPQIGYALFRGQKPKERL